MRKVLAKNKMTLGAQPLVKEDVIRKEKRGS